MHITNTHTNTRRQCILASIPASHAPMSTMAKRTLSNTHTRLSPLAQTSYLGLTRMWMEAAMAAMSQPRCGPFARASLPPCTRAISSWRPPGTEATHRARTASRCTSLDGMPGTLQGRNTRKGKCPTMHGDGPALGKNRMLGQISLSTFSQTRPLVHKLFPFQGRENHPLKPPNARGPLRG